MINRLQIDLFLSDPDYLALVELQREQRLLFITDLSETRVSAFLAWLFRPHEGHGLGDQAVRELLLNVWRKNHSEELQISVPTPREVLQCSFRDLLVETEYEIQSNIEGRGRRCIDIVLISRPNKLVIAIENKFGSSVHSRQLEAYRKGIQKKFPDFRHVLVYLDSNEENEVDDDSWVPLNYQWLITLISGQQKSGLLSDRALEALEQVRDYLNQNSATSVELEAEKDRLMQSIIIRHSEVLNIFRKFSGESWNARLEETSVSITEPLLIEYHQHWVLWNNVIAQSHHSEIVKVAKDRFGERLEISLSSTQVFFRLKEWARFDASPEEFWGPRISAWCGRDFKGVYVVSAGAVLSEILPDYEPQLRKVVEELRDPNLNAAPKTAQWVRISRIEKLSPTEASAQVVSELSRVELMLSTLI